VIDHRSGAMATLLHPKTVHEVLVEFILECLDEWGTHRSDCEMSARTG